jgi:hypothetical protein
MKTTLLIGVLTGVLAGLAAGLAGAAPLDSSIFTEVIRDVNILPAASDTTVPAHLNDVLKAPDRVRTGPMSRAELTAPDQTITRVGANTIFSFDGKNRALNLDQGSLLFHSPKGIGGGIIRSGGAAAAVLGTTIIVVATPTGGFKVILLEGHGLVTLPDGRSVKLGAGQLVFVLPGKGGFSPLFYFNLAKLTSTSLLVNGFPDVISSLPLIEKAIVQQQAALTFGNLSDNGKPLYNYSFLPGGPGSSSDPSTLHTGSTTQNPLPVGPVTPGLPPQPPHPLPPP